jgi:hypothetical protein
LIAQALGNQGGSEPHRLGGHAPAWQSVAANA